MKRLLSLLIIFALLLTAGCTAVPTEPIQPDPSPSVTDTPTAAPETPTVPEEVPSDEILQEVEKTGDVVILYTSDVHCAINQGFGYAGVQQIRNALEANGDAVILVDNGDSIQDDAVGMLTQGSEIIKLMNVVGYDAAIPGNHEFDYGLDRFLELTGQADFPYLSSNLTRMGEYVFAPYLINEAAGHKIALVGVTTPHSLHSSSPSASRTRTVSSSTALWRIPPGRHCTALCRRLLTMPVPKVRTMS